jgi:hypothetical protein
MPVTSLKQKYSVHELRSQMCIPSNAPMNSPPVSSLCPPLSPPFPPIFLPRPLAAPPLPPQPAICPQCWVLLSSCKPLHPCEGANWSDAPCWLLVGVHGLLAAVNLGLCLCGCRSYFVDLHAFLQPLVSDLLMGTWQQMQYTAHQAHCVA